VGGTSPPSHGATACAGTMRGTPKLSAARLVAPTALPRSSVRRLVKCEKGGDEDMQTSVERPYGPGPVGSRSEIPWETLAVRWCLLEPSLDAMLVPQSIHSLINHPNALVSSATLAF
jgi:hypothetical protein